MVLQTDVLNISVCFKSIKVYIELLESNIINVYNMQKMGVKRK